MRQRRFSVGVDFHMAGVKALHGARPDLLAIVGTDLGKYMFSDDARAYFRKHGTSSDSLESASRELKGKLLSTAGWARLRELNEELQRRAEEAGISREHIASVDHWSVGLEPTIYNVRPGGAPQPEHNRIREAEDEKNWMNAAKALMEERESRQQSQEMAVAR